MITLDTDLVAALNGRSSTYVVGVLFSFATQGAVGITNAPSDFTRNSQVYAADGGLKELSVPKVEAGVTRDLFSLNFTDVDFTLRDMLDIECSGTVVQVFLRYTTPVGARDLDIYTGTMSSFSSKVENNEHLITVTCVGPFSKLQHVTNRSTTDSSQKAVHSGDTAFSHVHDSDNEETIKWGGDS
jgi:hypothetical protein